MRLTLVNIEENAIVDNFLIIVYIFICGSVFFVEIFSIISNYISINKQISLIKSLVSLSSFHC